MKKDYTKYTFFLTHCHEDHLRGLSTTWNYGKIYTSRLSKNLIVNKFPNLKDLVVDLELDEEHWIYTDENKKEGVMVTLMDAYHCPGAIMFLFKGKMGTVLHTGDFRFDDKMLENEHLCPKEKANVTMRGITVDIDYLHLDNTFANPEYDFPSREEAYSGLHDIVSKHKEFRVYLFSYHLGKEEVFINIAKDFKTKIVVDEKRYDMLKLIEMHKWFTTDPEESKIHVKSIKDLSQTDV